MFDDVSGLRNEKTATCERWGRLARLDGPSPSVDGWLVTRGAAFYSSLGICLMVVGLFACARKQEATRIDSPGLTLLKQELAANDFRAIVNLHPPANVGSPGINDVAQRIAAEYRLEVLRVFSLVPAFVAIVDTAALVALVRDERVRSVEPDRRINLPLD